MPYFIRKSHLGANKRFGILCSHHLKTVKFLGGIWSRWQDNGSLYLVSQKGFVTGVGCPCFLQTLSHTRITGPMTYTSLLASEWQGKEEARESEDLWIPYCKSVKGRENLYKESRMPGNAPDLLYKYYSTVRDTTSVFDWYETNLCPKVSAITKVRVKFIRVACSTESNILVLVCDRIILDVLRKHPTALKKNP